jgi:hypothetical protein
MRLGSFVLTCVAAAVVCGSASAADVEYRDGGPGWAAEYRAYDAPARAYGYEAPRAYKNECNDDGDCRQEFRSGRCRVEREWNRDGHYKSEVECEGHDR